VIFEWHSRFKAGQVSVEDDERSGWPSTAKWHKMLKNSRTHPWRLPLSNPSARRHCWDQLWSLPGDLKRKFEHVLHYCKVCSPTPDKWSKAVAHKRVSWAMREG
jgi:hypothetical protein